MTDLTCEGCGLTTTYADASVEGVHEGCDGSEHEWTETHTVRAGADALQYIVEISGGIDGVATERLGEEHLVLSGNILNIDLLRDHMGNYRRGMDSENQVERIREAEQAIFDEVY